jgi:hypothetical protein
MIYEIWRWRDGGKMEEQRGMDICRQGGQVFYRATELKSNRKDKLRSPLTEHTESVTLCFHLYLTLVTRANFLPPSSISPFPSTTLFWDYHSSVFPCPYDCRGKWRKFTDEGTIVTLWVRLVTFCIYILNRIQYKLKSLFRVFLNDSFSVIKTILISFWLYKENNKLRETKNTNIFTLDIPPWWGGVAQSV